MTKFYFLLVIIALGAIGTASYVYVVQSKPEAASADKAAVKKFFSSDPDKYPTTGGKKMSVDF
jgi:uncharacterized protein (UPF0333 family)